MGQAQTSWGPSPHPFGSERARPGPRPHRPACEGRRGRGGLTSVYEVRICQGEAWVLFLGTVPPGGAKGHSQEAP